MINNPAFARPFSKEETGSSNVCHYEQVGMSIMDYFATHAMQALVSQLVKEQKLAALVQDISLNEETLIKASYIIAEGMMIERQNHNN